MFAEAREQDEWDHKKAKLQFTGTDIWYLNQIVDENIKSWYNCQ